MEARPSTGRSSTIHSEKAERNDWIHKYLRPVPKD